MVQFNIHLEPDLIEELGINDDTVIETYFSDGAIKIRIFTEEEESGGNDVNHASEGLCSNCPLFCKILGICMDHSDE